MKAVTVLLVAGALGAAGWAGTSLGRRAPQAAAPAAARPQAPPAPQAPSGGTVGGYWFVQLNGNFTPLYTGPSGYSGPLLLGAAVNCPGPLVWGPYSSHRAALDDAEACNRSKGTQQPSPR